MPQLSTEIANPYGEAYVRLRKAKQWVSLGRGVWLRPPSAQYGGLLRIVRSTADRVADTEADRVIHRDMATLQQIRGLPARPAERVLQERTVRKRPQTVPTATPAALNGPKRH